VGGPKRQPALEAPLQGEFEAVIDPIPSGHLVFDVSEIGIGLDAIDWLVIVGQSRKMCALGTHVICFQKEVCRKRALHTKTPLLYVRISRCRINGTDTDASIVQLGRIEEVTRKTVP